MGRCKIIFWSCRIVANLIPRAFLLLRCLQVSIEWGRVGNGALTFPIINYRMAQTTKWLPAILDYMKNVMSSISMCLAKFPKTDS